MIKRLAKLIVPREYRQLFMDAQMARFRLAALERRVEMLAGHVNRSAYRDIASDLAYLPLINRHEFSVYSQNGEDGILLFLFSIIGASSRQFVEFGVGDGRECNSANLLINFGWRGAILECMPDFVSSARRHYDHVLRDRAGDLSIVNAMITTENVNQTLRPFCAGEEVDLASIDIDGNDYWVWKALEVCHPRVFVVEYAAVMGLEKSISVTYDPAFSRFDKHPSGLYAGASLRALVKLGRQKGYAFVGCDRHGVNAFFVRQDLMRPPLEELTVEQGYFATLLPGLASFTPADFHQIQHMPFAEV